jgi:hypothetical protein
LKAGIPCSRRVGTSEAGALEKLACDLVELRAAGTSQSAIAAKKATTTIPIVMAATGGDPVALGLVASLARAAMSPASFCRLMNYRERSCSF